MTQISIGLLLIMLWWPVTAAQAAVTLMWNASAGAQGYKLYYGRTSGVYDIMVEVGPYTSAMLNGSLTGGETYVFAATAYNDAGESGYSNEVSARIAPVPPADTQQPIVQITQPANGATVERKSHVLVSATATDNVGVTQVEFYVDGNQRCIVVSLPYQCLWAVPAPPRHTYTLEARAFDAAGNQGISPPIVVRSSQ